MNIFFKRYSTRLLIAGIDGFLLTFITIMLLYLFQG